jgi:ATP-dependent RNA helicase RhlE
MRFSDFALSAPILSAVADEGYETPTPIQEAAIPPILEGRDLLGCAQTGTGKTAAFALPILENLSHAQGEREVHDRPPARGAGAARGREVRPPRRKLRVLVLSPTRELAAQIGDSFGAYGRRTGLRHTVIFGGVNQNRQIDALERGVDILVATPGRLLDLIGQGEVSLSDLTVFVLDEADRMLDMGFVHDVKRIAALVPKQRQTLLFSATMPESIRALAASLLRDPVEVAVTPVASTAETVTQAIYFVEKADKRALLSWVLEREHIDRAIVFTRTKHGANRVAEYLEKRGVSAAAIHGNKSQNARERALLGFKQGRLRALIATDIAARGIDIDELAFVINFDLPNVPEAYVHRIGRTGRAGASGRALSFCESEERPYLVDIERLIKQHIPVVVEHPYPSSLGVPRPTDLAPRRGQRPAPAPTHRREQPPAGRRDPRDAARREPLRDEPRRERFEVERRERRPEAERRERLPEAERRQSVPPGQPREGNHGKRQESFASRNERRQDEPRRQRADEPRRDQRAAEPRHQQRAGEPRDDRRAEEPRRERREDERREPAHARESDRRGHAQPHPDRAHRGEPERHAHRDRAREAR